MVLQLISNRLILCTQEKAMKMQPFDFIAVEIEATVRLIFFYVHYALTETNLKVLRYLISNLFIAIKSYDRLLDDQNVFELYNFLSQGLIN